MVPIDFTLILPFFAEENNTLFNSVLGGVLKTHGEEFLLFKNAI